MRERRLGVRRQELAFELLWRASRRRLRRWGPAVVLAGRYVSAIVRPPAPLAASLASVADELRRLDGGHHIYPPASIHVTVLNLDPWLGQADGEARVLDAVRTALAATPPLAFRVRGLGASPSTILAELVSPDESLAAARRRVRAHLGPAPGGRRWASVAIGLVGIAYANLIRFRGPVAPALVDRVSTLRHQELGAFAAEAVEVVRTDRVLTESATELVARVTLGQPPPA